VSLVIKSDGVPVHYPKRADHFEFDEEVSEIFEDMAQRSIPMYGEVHRINAAIIERHKKGKRPPYVIWDIGGSTGMAEKALADRLGFYAPHGCQEIAAHIIDVSEPMLKKVHQKLPWTVGHALDITQQGWTETPGLPQPDCIILNYVLQFVKGPYKSYILKACARALRPRGLLLIAQKEAAKANSSGVVTAAMDESYIQFRRDNGYTDDEIERKTAALKNAMWLTTKQTTLTTLYESGFDTVYETTRWCQFASYACTKTKSGDL
jgi:tRNA (cmo5U34)-methyltransferase